jgi:tetratricopeptide (TPR) repeat protein
MFSAATHPRRLIVVAAVVGACFALTTASGAEDEDWRGKALALNDVTGDGPMTGEIQSWTAKPEAAKQLLATAVTIAKEKDQPLNYNAAYILASVSLNLKDYKSSQTFFEVCAQQALRLRSGQKFGQAYLGLLSVIDGLSGEKDYDRAIKLCQAFLEKLEQEGVGKGLKDDILRRMVRALAKQGKTDEAWRIVDNLLKVRAGDWRNTELKGWLHQETGHSAEAAQTYEQLLNVIAKDNELDKEGKAELTADVHYMLSGVYVDIDRIDKAGQHLQLLLKQYPNEAKYNNDLGFIWADHDMHLDEAERMIRKALDEDRKQRHKAAGAKVDPENDKDNAAYLDSLGWVLYKKKKYEEAKPYLQKAVEDKEGQHVEIYDHLAEVYQALGQHAEAVAAWKKAVEVAGTTRREQDRKTEVEKKLKQMK